MIANMAMSDLLFPIFLFHLNLVEMQADTWHISDPLYQTLCKIGFFLSTISAAVSIQSLILITVDRFGAVVVPIRSPLISKTHCPFFIIASWIVAEAAYSPYLFSFKLTEHPGGMARCTRQTLPTYIYQHLAVSVAFFYFPFVLLIILYSIILIKLIKQHVRPGEHSANAEEQRLRGNWNVLKMAFVIVFVFFLCWIPSVSNWTILPFAPFCIWFSCNFLLYDTFTYFMAVVNCAIKPLMCLIFSSNYRQDLNCAAVQE